MQVGQQYHNKGILKTASKDIMKELYEKLNVEQEEKLILDPKFK